MNAQPTSACHVAAPTTAFDTKVRYRTVQIDGVRVFYREAGPRDAPTLLLLHGFPSSSHMFRHLMPALADPLARGGARLPWLRCQLEFPVLECFAYGFVIVCAD